MAQGFTPSQITIERMISGEFPTAFGIFGAFAGG